MATATSPVAKRTTDARTNPNRSSVISEPILAAKTGLGISEGGVDGDLGAKQDGEGDESEFEALMVSDPTVRQYVSCLWGGC